MSALVHPFHNDAHDCMFTLRVVGDGDPYGLNMGLRHAGDDPLVEFYDQRWPHDHDSDGTMLGQFVARYRLSTLLEPDATGRCALERDGLMLDGGTGWSVGPDGLRACLHALIEADLCPDLTEARMDRVEALTARLDAIAEARREWAETDPAAGDGYSHLPREGGWSFGNGPERLEAWMSGIGLDRRGLGIEAIEDLVLENFRMQPGGMRDPSTQDPDLFVVDSFPVGEMRIPLDRGEIAPDAPTGEWKEACAASILHPDGDGGLLPSDAVWYAVIRREQLENLIEAAAGPEDTPQP